MFPLDESVKAFLKAVQCRLPQLCVEESAIAKAIKDEGYALTIQEKEKLARVMAGINTFGAEVPTEIAETLLQLAQQLDPHVPKNRSVVAARHSQHPWKTKGAR